MKISIHDFPFSTGAIRENHEWVSHAPNLLKPMIANSLRKFGHEIDPEGDFQLSLGGDHFISIQSIFKAKPTHVIWLDAHADFNTPETTLTGNWHGMVLSSLCGMVPAMKEFECLQSSNICWYGVRDIDELELDLLQSENANLASNFEELQKWINSIGQDSRIHVSLDVDFFDPEIAPASGTLVPNGASLENGIEVLSFLKNTGLVHSIDIVEYNPRLDKGNMTMNLIQDCIEAFFRE
jgi:arginase